MLAEIIDRDRSPRRCSAYAAAAGSAKERDWKKPVFTSAPTNRSIVPDAVAALALKHPNRAPGPTV
jgi:hypothetical protein